MDGRADRGTLDNAKRRISQLLDESIVAQNGESNEGTLSTGMADAAEKKEYYIKAWKQIDLSKFDIDKLREQFTVAPYKNIEISDLRAFIITTLRRK